MKLLLPLALISVLASCTSPKNQMRPSAEIPGQGAPATNKGLGYVSKGVGQTATSAHDLTDDTIDYGGKVAVRQSRNYTKIGFNSARRSNDLALRESKRYTDHALDVYDDAADLEIRAVKGWPKFASKSARRALNTTRRVYQTSVDEYGKAVDRTYFSAWNVIIPPEPKPWMVGSLNDRLKPAKVPGGVWTADFATTEVEVAPAADGKGYNGRITK